MQCSCEKNQRKIDAKSASLQRKHFEVSLIFVGCDSESISLFVGKESLNYENEDRKEHDDDKDASEMKKDKALITES